MSTNLNLAANLATAQTMVDTSWMNFDAAAMEGAFALYTQSIPGDGATVLELDFNAAFPVMEKLMGSRTYDVMRGYSFQIRYDTYTATFALKRPWVQYDRTGLIQQSIDASMQRTRSAYDRSVTALYDSASGAGPTGFDGVALFNATHPHGPAAATQSNLGAGTALSSANLAAAEYTGALWVDEKGETTSTTFDMVRTGPKLKRRVLELLSQDRIVTVSSAGVFDATSSVVAGATRTNTWNGELKAIVDPRVTTFFWDLVDTKQSAKPMVLFDLMAPQPEARFDMNDPHVFDKDEFLYGAKGDWGVGAGHWHTCYRGTGTA